MAHISGPDAEVYAQVCRAADDDENFDVATAVHQGSTYRPAVTPVGKTPFKDMTNADTIAYKAVSLEDPSKWEIGIGTASTSTAGSETLNRSDANVQYSSNSDNTVDFRRADGSAGDVLVVGVPFPVTDKTFAVTNWTSDVAMDCNAAADAEICDVLGTLIDQLIKAGIIKGSVAA
jgi:hypothetical protein